MFILILAGGFAVAFVLLVLCLWAVSAAIDKDIKHYIDYAKEGKEHGRR